MSSSTQSVLFGVVAALAAVAGLVVAQLHFGSKTPSIESGTLLSKPRPIAEFQLVDSAGHPFGRSRLEGQWTLIFTGFTYCPDVCPNTLAVLKGVKARLDEAKVPLQVVFVSVDPERDTGERLGLYTHYFNPDFIGATGNRDNLDSLTRSLSLIYAKVPGTTPDSYTMDHSAALVLVNPQAEVAGYFLPPHRPEALVRDLENVVRRTPAR